MINPIKQRLQGINQILTTINSTASLSFIVKCSDGAVVGFNTTITDAQTLKTYKFLEIGNICIVTIGYKGNSRIILNYAHSCYFQWRQRFKTEISGLTLVKTINDIMQKQLSKPNTLPVSVNVLVYDSYKKRLDKLSLDTTHETHEFVIASGVGNDSFTDKLTVKESQISNLNTVMQVEQFLLHNKTVFNLPHLQIRKIYNKK